MKIFLPYFSLLTLTFSSIFGNAERDFHSNNGQKIKGTVQKFYEDGDILLKRSKDNQLFRISLDIFTEDDQAFVRNNFAPNHDALPEFQRPLSASVLQANARFIDSLIEKKLDSYKLRPNKIASEEVFLRRAYLKIIGRIPTFEETTEFLEDRVLLRPHCQLTLLAQCDFSECASLTRIHVYPREAEPHPLQRCLMVCS